MNRSSFSAMALTVLSAFCFAVSFPSFLDKSLHPSFAFLIWIALVPFLTALEGASLRRAAFLGFLWGFAAYGTVQYWVIFLKEAQHLAAPSWAALTAVMGLHYLLLAAVYVWLRRRLPRFGLFWAPLLWTAIEYLRTAPPVVSYPWALMGATQAPYPSMLHLTSVTGVWGLTFLIAWVNAALAEVIRSDRGSATASRGRRAILAAPVVVALLAWGWGWLSTRHVATPGRQRVVLVQPSIDQSVKWNRSMESATYDLLEKLTSKAVKPSSPTDPAPSLVVWPETAAPSYLSLNPVAMEKVRSIVRKNRVSLLAGCLDAVKVRPGRIAQYNAAMHFGPDGRERSPYRKRHLVPFGEYVPAQKVFSFLGPVVADLGCFDAGEKYQVFPARDFTYSPLICYEAIFPDETRRAVRGADALVNISNDAWYGTTAAPYQHALLAVVRAAENGKPLLRCANTGISLVADPDGRILAETRLFEQTLLKVPVRFPSRGTTLYARFGDWFARLASALAALALVVSFFMRPTKPVTEKAHPYPDLSQFGDIEIRPPHVGLPPMEPPKSDPPA